MPPEMELNYNDQIFDPPAPAVWVELRSPDSPNSPTPVRLVALLDSGAFTSAIPETVIETLHLYKIDEIQAGDYNAEEDKDFRTVPVYWIHLTIPYMEPIWARVIPKKPKSHATIGRNIINEWLLTLDGPKLKCCLKLTTEIT
ncbi:unnamed protein product [marine sediment metagenome]|uniref:Peptidase A2 domain-containing protein n=1 Tax=marine sediment metagenome TaxID=412755 RepID=X1IGY7_9ZZZZ